MNELSSEPSALRRAMRERFVPSTSVNEPAMTMRPVSVAGGTWLVCSAMEETVLFGPVPSRLKMVVLTEPSGLSMATRLRGRPSIAVKSPPMRYRPLIPCAGSALAMNVTASTLSFGPFVVPNAVFTDPAGVPAGGSLSKISSVAARPAAERVAPPVALASVSSTVRFGGLLTFTSSTRGTVNVRLVWPAAKVKVPLTGVNSLAEAVPGLAL